MFSPMVIFWALVAIAVYPVAAQELTDGAVVGIAVGAVVGFIVILMMVLLCCWMLFYQRPEPPMVVPPPPRPVITVPAPPQPPRVITRIFPFGGGPPIIREEPIGLRRPEFINSRRPVGYY